MSVDGQDPENQKIDDKYDHSLDANPDGAKDEKEDKRDAATKRREDFLNIYKEDKGGNDGGDDDTPDLSKGIKFKRDPDETEEDFKMRTSKEEILE